jgi:serine phosphatase RsbU (regulator of sigma subunit)/Tfp pilus assembly protein PilF
MSPFFYQILLALISLFALPAFAQKDIAAKTIASKTLRTANDYFFEHLDSLDRSGDYAGRLALINATIDEAKAKKCDSLLPYMYNALGNFYNSVGNYDQAIVAFREGEQASNKLENKAGLVNVYTNIGNTFYFLENTDKALEYYQRGIDIADKLPNKNDYLGTLYNNVGSIYGLRKQFDKSRFYFHKSYEISLVIGDSLSIAYSLNNFANVFLELDQNDSALIYFEKAKDLKEKFGTPDDKADAYNQLASTNLKLGRTAEARAYALKALALDSSMYTTILKNTYEVLVNVSEKNGDIKEAYKYYKLSRLVKDSIMGNEKVQDALVRDFKYEQELRDLKKEAEMKEMKTWNTILYVGLVAGLLFLLFIVNRLRHSRKQRLIIEAKNEELNHQKEIVEEKNKEITDSINYAKRLQDAILPAIDEVSKCLPESFIYYQPKDIVAGDFYWFEHLDHGEEEILLIAAADSTGHGVPGAMVSVVCSNALHRAVNEFRLDDPAQILNKTKEFVIRTFKNTNQEVKDGMDISLLRLKRKKSNGQLLEVTWAGANNPLWLVRKGALLEYKADKQPVGMHMEHKSFTTQNIVVEKNDCLFLFTDGYSDQFGGSSGKKLKSKEMKAILTEAAALPIDQQKEFVSKKFNAWKTTYEQVDDVCVIGIRL